MSGERQEGERERDSKRERERATARDNEKDKMLEDGDVKTVSALRNSLLSSICSE